MVKKLAPTRGNLVKIQRSVIQAQNGHNLLEQKRQVLMMELVRHIEVAKKIQSDVASIFQDAYGALQRANISLGIDAVEDIATAIPTTADIVIRLRSIMGVEIPDIDSIDTQPLPSYSYHGSSGAMDEAYEKFRRVLGLIIELAEVETSVYRLAVQIRKTHRRVNALEKVAIPSALQEMRFISDVLEEGEREDFVRMKKAKENRMQREGKRR